jgi:predicted membrane protein
MVVASTATAPAPAPILMKGGAKEHMLDLVRKYAAPLNLYVGILLVIGCVFVKQIPAPIKAHADSLLGRFTLFFATLVLADLYSWPYGILMALFAVLLISMAPRAFEEGFQSDKGNQGTKIVSQKEKWFIEKALDENPLAIEEDRVRTQAIQDNTTGSNSTTSSR